MISWPSRNTDPSTCWLSYPVLITGAATTVSGSALTTTHPPSAIWILLSGVRPLIIGFQGYPHIWPSVHKFGVPSTPLFWQLSRKTHRTQENILLTRRLLLEQRKKKKERKDINENQTKEEVHRVRSEGVPNKQFPVPSPSAVRMHHRPRTSVCSKMYTILPTR